jgi:hypothetical protein
LTIISKRINYSLNDRMEDQNDKNVDKVNNGRA